MLTCDDPTAAEPALLWNGKVGLRFGRDGSSWDTSHHRLPMFFIDGYTPTGEEKITPYQNPLREAPSFDGAALSLEHCTDYHQSIDMRTGALVTTWSQPSLEGTELKVQHTVVLHPTERRLAERWEFSLPNSVGPQKPIAPFPATTPGDIHAPGGLTILFDATQGGSQDAKTTTAFLERVEEIGSPSPSEPKPKTVRQSFGQVLEESKKVWAERWKTDIEIDGPAEDQLAVRSFLFYLRSAVSPGTRMSVSPFGLSSDTYSGHVFWDADIWVFPALALIAPKAAAVIPQYRLANMDQASKNLTSWLSAGRPTGSIPLGASSGQGLLFPWESSVTGRETVPGPSKYEHHITGSVAFSLSQAAALGLVPESEARKAIDGADKFFKLRSVAGQEGREIRGVMSPDENHVGDNDLYTNLLAEWAANGGKWASNAKATYKLPKDGAGLLTYDGDPMRGYKQAAAVLSIYPLQYPPAEKDAKKMMERFSSKVIKNGPAMSDSVHAIIWARAGDSEKAYLAWKSSWQPFMTGPLGLFSEKRSRPTAYFVTGAAGSLQSVLYGILGIRLDSKNRSENAWSKQLLGDRVMSVAPHLPSTWKSVKLKNFTVLGRRYSLTATQAPNGGTSQITQGD